jgi:predicted ATP-grasp superfamily ATP-dependent carboligase
VRDVPHEGEVIRAGHPVCTVFGTAPTRSACEAALRTEAARIEAACVPVDPDGVDEGLAGDE